MVIRRSLKWLLISVGSALVLMLIIALLGIGILVYAHRSGKLNVWLGDAFESKVQYQVAQFHWQGINPVVELKHIVIIPRNTQHLPIKLAFISMRLNLLSSLLHLSPVTDSIGVQGMQVNVHESASGLRLDGLSSQSAQGKTNLSWSFLAPWLALQQNIHLSNTTLVVHRPHQTDLVLSGLDVLWQRVAAAHYRVSISSSVMVKQTTGSLQAMANIEGNLLNAQTLNLHFYGDINAPDFAAVAKGLSFKSMRVLHGGGRIRVWGQWQDGNLKRLHSVVNLARLSVINQDLKLKFNIDAINENLLWQRQRHGWQVLMQRSDSVGKGFDNHIQVRSSQGDQGTTWQVAMSRVNISLLSRIIELLPKTPDHIVTLLNQTAPTGTLDNLSAAVTLKANKIVGYSVAGKVNNFSEQGWQKVPPVYGISGSMQMNQHKGVLLLDSADMSVGQGYLFPRGWPKSHLKLSLAWEQQDHQWLVDIQHLSIENPWLQWSVLGSLTLIPDNWRESELTLTSHMQLNHAEKVFPYFMPHHLTNENLVTWFNSAFVDQPYLNSQLVWRGRLSHFPYQQHQGVLQLGVQAPQGYFRPYMGWPVINGVSLKVLVNGPTLTGQAQGGDSLGVKLQQAQVHIDNVWRETPLHLTVDAKANGSAAQLWASHSPLKDRLAQVDRHLAFSGPIAAHIKLTQGLTDEVDSEVKGRLKMQGVNVHLIVPDLMVYGAKGTLLIRNNLLLSQDIKANFFGHVLHVTIHHKPTSGQSVVQTLTATGTLDAQHLASLLPSLPTMFAGQSQFQYRLGWGDDIPTTAQLTSNLKGFAIHLPVPLAKAANAITPSKLSILFPNSQHPHQTLLQFHIGDLLAGNAQLQQDALTKAIIKLGVASIPTLPAQNIIQVSGIIPYINLDHWLSVLARLSTSKTVTEPAWLARTAVSLKLGQLLFQQRSFSKMDVNAVRIGQRWRIDVNSQQALGHILLPGAKIPLLAADFDYLYWPKSTASQHKQSVKPVSAQSLHQLPPLKLAIKRVYLAGQALGALQWQSRPVVQGIEVPSFKLDGQLAQLSLSAKVQRFNTQWDNIHLSGQVKGKNWGKLLSAFGFNDLLEDAQGKVQVNLNWFGKLTKPILSTLQGDVKFNLQDGAISAVDPGMMKMLGLFSVGSLFKRLSLNFTDLTEKGLSFDSLKGEYKIQNSIAHTDAVYLDGPSVNLVLRGDINLAEKTLNQNVVVMPQVGGGIALAAGLIGGPIVGVATWVADKVLVNTVLRNRGLLFHVSGPWDNPVIKSVQ